VSHGPSCVPTAVERLVGALHHDLLRYQLLNLPYAEAAQLPALLSSAEGREHPPLSGGCAPVHPAAAG
jgi:hypothetical protein